MITLSTLRIVPGSRKNPKRVGRGIGSGTGKTCGRGQKGQKSRSGGNPHPWFEGGQMPLQRRLPKRGFHSPFRKIFEIVNVSSLNNLTEDQPVNPDFMKEKGLIKKTKLVKILGNGEISRPLTIEAHKFTRSAVEKIEKAGGKAVIIK